MLEKKTVERTRKLQFGIFDEDVFGPKNNSDSEKAISSEVNSI